MGEAFHKAWTLLKAQLTLDNFMDRGVMGDLPPPMAYTGQTGSPIAFAHDGLSASSSRPGPLGRREPAPMELSDLQAGEAHPLTGKPTNAYRRGNRLSHPRWRGVKDLASGQTAHYGDADPRAMMGSKGLGRGLIMPQSVPRYERLQAINDAIAHIEERAQRTEDEKVKTLAEQDGGLTERQQRFFNYRDADAMGNMRERGAELRATQDRPLSRDEILESRAYLLNRTKANRRLRGGGATFVYPTDPYRAALNTDETRYSAPNLSQPVSMGSFMDLRSEQGRGAELPLHEDWASEAKGRAGNWVRDNQGRPIDPTSRSRPMVVGIRPAQGPAGPNQFTLDPKMYSGSGALNMGEGQIIEDIPPERLVYYQPQDTATMNEGEV